MSVETEKSKRGIKEFTKKRQFREESQTLVQITATDLSVWYGS